MTLSKALFSSARDDWETPSALFAEWNERFSFTLDVCAFPTNAKCALYFTKEHNSLLQDWGTNRCWMNPPYGREIGKWISKAWDACGRGALVVGLLPSRTDTKWWHLFVQPIFKDPALGEVHFLKGRLKFVGAKAHAPFPSVIVVWRPRGPVLN